MINIAYFSTSDDTNLEYLQKFINNKKLNDINRSDSINIKMVFINNRKSYSILNCCRRLGLKYMIIDDYYINNNLLNKLKSEKIDFIVLSDFYKLIPNKIVKYFNSRIINIHPSLLPKYSGKGMYGINVHKKIIENNEKYSGFSVHYIDEQYNKGEIIFKIRQRVNRYETPQSLFDKIKKEENKWYPIIIYSLCSKLNKFN